MSLPERKLKDGAGYSVNGLILVKEIYLCQLFSNPAKTINTTQISPSTSLLRFVKLLKNMALNPK